MRLSEMMGYQYSAGFPRARDALAAWCKVTGEKIKIPSNCCSALLPFASELVPIDPETGLAPVPVQLYGYRQIFPGAKLEIDPLLTGLFGQPFAESCIVSFGYSKTIDIGGGGMLLTNNEAIFDETHKFSFFPQMLVAPLHAAIDNLFASIMEKKRQYEEIENEFYNIRLAQRPIIPWRFIGRDKCPLGVRNRAKELGYKFGRNYPPLPGVEDEGARRFAWEVVNIWK